VELLNKENRDLIDQLKTLNESINLLTKVTAISVGKEAIFKSKKEAGDKIDALDEYDLPDKIIAMFIGSTEGSVSSTRSQKKAKAKVKTKLAQSEPPQPQEAEKE
jgi:hypothetical protein